MVDRERLRMAGWVLAAIVAVVLGLRLLGSGESDAGDPVVAASGPAAAPGNPSAASAAAPEVLVQVAGEVARPGVYRVTAGARVNDAVARAGGLTRRADPAGVNLVARVQDGQQVVVPRRGASGVAATGLAEVGGAGAAPSAGPVSLSSATVAQLDTLDGIGPTLAQRIVEYRQAHGGFSSIDQLRQVDGIGEKRFAALKEGVAP
jgi:competence protein ComEA